MAIRLPIGLELAGARLVGRVSRLARAGGGTTLPGKLLWRLDPGALDRLALRLPLGSAVVSATNGKTTTSAMVASILGGRIELAHNRAGANLVSGVVSALVAAPAGAQLGLFELDEAHLPEVVRRIRPRAICFGNLFRDQLDRYGELEQVAERWRGAVAELPAETIVVANADDPQVGSLADGRAGAILFGLDDPRHAHPLQHAADSKYCIRCGTPYDYAAAYVGHLGDYRCPNCGHARPPLDVVARAIELDGLEGSRFTLALAGTDHSVRLRLPGLYNVYNALAAAALAHALGAAPEEIVTGLERSAAAFGRSERIAVGDKRVLVLLVKNPAGANEVVRTLLDAGAPRHAVIALNDAIADGKDVSWIWDVDFEPLLAGMERIVASGDRAAELALRLRYGGFAGELEVVSDLERALDRGLELTAAGGELVVLPTYTAMLALRRIVAGRGFVRPYWEKAA
ncbi:MAG: hypothetical protein QOE29_2379 [Gaiellaceae bacterium]|nr:hypothetical protein [Gaiellaceae bacterium]